ncbi:copper resistance protein CopC [Burkholderia sp. YI23]|jgi:methionine-rich copper-binding protein CopC|uniref:copper homeostasis periplasmic binding protein CopC n=1 Tax=unclassified Caballeronia TaxID=2646786 RepID=UPI0002387AD2|nr:MULTISPECIES: copper homeostasis periplasmic binding protein CopC [unclassified Caballeronia]AET90369.1 copper resistance protein CopC [Burkholderia sp. YI23]MDR5794223.1 copper homeostasis periplasmic binding protein CopC [Caballeronia sp. LZ008]
MKNRINKGLAPLLATVALGLLPVAASAHGKLESATPAAGSTVDATPDALRLTFNENIESSFSTIKVLNAAGAPATKEKATVDSTNPRVLKISLPKLDSGLYTVQWGVMTSDSHKTKGTYTFTVK